MSHILSSLLSILFSQKIVYRIKQFINYIYTSIWKNRFHKVGENIKLEYPCQFYGVNAICIGNNFSAKKRFQLETFKEHNGVFFNPEILIGDNVSINYDVHIGCCNKIIIGNNVLIGSKVFISDHSHGKSDRKSIIISPSKRILYSKGAVIIKDNVWIGEGCAILPNVIIGENSIIGANSVVTKDVPPYSVVAGVPAKVIKILKKE